MENTSETENTIQLDNHQKQMIKEIMAIFEESDIVDVLQKEITHFMADLNCEKYQTLFMFCVVHAYKLGQCDQLKICMAGLDDKLQKLARLEKMNMKEI